MAKFCEVATTFVFLGLLAAPVSAEEFAVAVIDRPTSLPQGTSSAALHAEHAVAAGASTSLAGSVSVGLSDTVDLGADLPSLDLQPEAGVGSPAIYGSYGWDINERWALVPTVTVGLPVFAGASATSLGLSLALSVLVTDWLELGLAPGASVEPWAQGAGFQAPAYAFVQLSNRVFLQGDVGVGAATVVAVGRDTQSFVAHESTRLEYVLSLGYALGRSDHWVIDLVGQGGILDTISDPAEPTAVGAGLIVAGYWVWGS